MNDARGQGRVLGLIPARGGSKGIPLKNLTPLAGKPLLQYVAEAGLGCAALDRLVVSSDCAAIIEAAQAMGVEAPFIRPDNLATDQALVVDVIAHALRWFTEREDAEFEYVCLLQPTAPFAQAGDYERAIRLAQGKCADTVISVSRCGQLHPEVMVTLDEDGGAEWFLRNGSATKMARRQDLPPVYVRSGVVYVFRSQMILESGELYGGRLYAIEVPEERALGIDTPLDLAVAETVLQRAVR